MAATLSGPCAPFSQADIDRALSALVAWNGNFNATVRYLESLEAAGEARAPGAKTLSEWARVSHWERYEQIREQWSARVEQTVANDMRDAAREAVEVQRLAVNAARERLEAGKDDDPARSAANLARVAQSNTDKLLSLTGRPTQITETRNVNEILRSLVAKGVLTLPEGSGDDGEPAQITEVTEATGDE